MIVIRVGLIDSFCWEGSYRPIADAVDMHHNLLRRRRWSSGIDCLQQKFLINYTMANSATKAQCTIFDRQFQKQYRELPTNTKEEDGESLAF